MALCTYSYFISKKSPQLFLALFEINNQQPLTIIKFLCERTVTPPVSHRRSQLCWESSPVSKASSMAIVAAVAACSISIHWVTLPHPQYLLSIKKYVTPKNTGKIIFVYVFLGINAFHCFSGFLAYWQIEDGMHSLLGFENGSIQDIIDLQEFFCCQMVHFESYGGRRNLTFTEARSLATEGIDKYFARYTLPQNQMVEFVLKICSFKLSDRRPRQFYCRALVVRD